jgi:hypothetical protein
MNEFRESASIDFSTGTVKAPPMELIGRWGPRAKQPLEMMLVVFECRMDTWKLG